MIRKIFAAAFLILMMTSQGSAMDIAGIQMPESLGFGKTSLVLNGAGTRTKFFLKLYVGGLYLQQKNQAPEAIIEADEPMAIRLHIISSLITSERMEESTREGFEKSTEGNIGPIKDKIEQLISVFKEEIKINDIYDLVYVPGKGVEIYKNATFHSFTEGLPFKRALFGIWLGDNPVQKSLKKEMLGKSTI
jgi:hypothetical protein